MPVFAPVYRFAKPKPKVEVNEQGIPKKTGKKRSSVQNPTYNPVPDKPWYESLPGEDEPDDSMVQSGPSQVYNQPESVPQRPFHELEETTFPISDFGPDGEALFRGVAEGSGGHQMIGEWAGDQGHGTDSPTGRAMAIMSAAAQMHSPQSGRIHSMKAQNTDIPVGHVKLAKWPMNHVAQIHYPEGTVTTYRARLNDDDTGYR